MQIVVFDIETTDLSPNKGHIVEIGAVLLDTQMETKTVLMNYVVHEDGMTESEVRNSWIVKNGYMTFEELS